jgi:prepilin-type N-terminal cleavage/methylation domain-containing protein
MNSLDKRAFTLIEVLVSVMLIFIIGFTLTKISSQNINTIQSSKDDITYLYSTVVTTSNEYRDINDYLAIKDIPRYSYTVETKKVDLGSSSIVLSETFVINYNLERENIKSDYTTKSFFRIK